MKVHKQKEKKSMEFLWQLWERCLASQSVSLRWTSHCVLRCCSIALFTSASCPRPIWSEAHRVLTAINASVNSPLRHFGSVWSFAMAFLKRPYIPLCVLKVFTLKTMCFIFHVSLKHHLMSIVSQALYHSCCKFIWVTVYVSGTYRLYIVDWGWSLQEKLLCGMFLPVIAPLLFLVIIDRDFKLSLLPQVKARFKQPHYCDWGAS